LKPSENELGMRKDERMTQELITETYDGRVVLHKKGCQGYSWESTDYTCRGTCFGDGRCRCEGKKVRCACNILTKKELLAYRKKVKAKERRKDMRTFNRLRKKHPTWFKGAPKLVVE